MNRTRSRARVLLDGREILTGYCYQKRRAEVLARDHWRCVHCGSGYAVEVHHRGKRSLLRDDRASNLETLCRRCHGREHGVPYAKA